MTHDPSVNHELDHLASSHTESRRGPITPLEQWAAQAIVLIAGVGPAGVTRRNGSGFGAVDFEIGESLAFTILKRGPYLTESQWLLADRLAMQYREQVTDLTQALLASPSPSSISPASDHPAPKPRRGPATPLEAWATRALVLIAGLDPDGARVRNSEGFSSADVDLGHSFATAITKYGPRMTERQWPLVVRLATRYRGQVEATDPMPSTGAAASGVGAGAGIGTAPTLPSESPEIEALKADHAAGEYVLDAILATPVGQACGQERARNLAAYRWGVGGIATHAALVAKAAQAVGERCLNVDQAGAFGACAACGLGFGKSGAQAGKGNRICAALAWIASLRARILDAAGHADQGAEVRADMGLEVRT